MGPGQNKIGYTTKRLIEEARKEFESVEIVPITKVKLKINKDLDAIFGKNSLRNFDYILPRIDSKRAQVGYPVVRFLDDMGVKKPYPAETILIAHNKFITLEEFAKKGITVPETFLTGSRESALEILDKQKMPILLKLLSGFGGKGVLVMDSKEAARSAIDTMRTLEQDVLIEKFIQNPGEDIRGIVAGDEVIASFKRIAAKGEKKANISAGGKGEAFKLTDEMQDITLRCAEATKSKICAVDMIEGRDGIHVIEVNINPGIEGIEKATNTNVASKIIGFVKEEAKR
jgi:ribosomal protein S6--L-glutamate ligase